jgi:uncharacterized membrane protein YphA (DoxX/SURF4 family)
MTSERKFAFLRIAFGFVWGIDAWFKWQPAFITGLIAMLTSMIQGQPAWVRLWITFWIHLIGNHPHGFAILIALIETVIAFGLVFGFLTRITLVVSIMLGLLIWSIGEGFGGPYIAGSTDIGCAIIYVFVAIALYFGACWQRYSLDSLLARKYPNSILWKNHR